MRSSSGRTTQMPEWQMMAINGVSFTCKKHIWKLWLTVNLETASSSTGKQQRSHWLADLVYFEFSVSYTYPDDFSWGYAVAFRSSPFTESWKAVQVFPAPLPRQEQLCNGKSIRRSAASCPRPPGLAYLSKQIWAFSLLFVPCGYLLLGIGSQSCVV